MRFLFLLFCCCLLSSLLLSQSRFSYGINLQVGLSSKTNLWEDENDFVSSTARYTRYHVATPVVGAGIWANYALGKKLSVQSGLQYANTGNTEVNRGFTEIASLSSTISAYDYTTKFRVHQLQLPLELKAEIGQGKIKPVVSLGVQLSYEWLGKIYREDDVNLTNDDRAHVTRWKRNERKLYHFNALDVQPVLGLGLRLNEQMTVRLRHVWKLEEQSIQWGNSGIEADFILFSPITVPSFPFRTRSNHRRYTTIEMSYRLY